MAKVDPNFSHDVFRFIPAEVRDLDTSGVLERFMNGIQAVFEGQQTLIGNLDTLHDLDAIDDAFLVHLKHHVGWTAELDSITDALTSDQLRKLIELSVPFWKRKGTEPGIRDALRLLTGRDVVIRNWFYYRWIVGVARLWHLGDERDPFVTGGTFGDRDQYLSMIYVSTEVVVDKQLVRDLVNLHRPVQEVVKVVYCDLVDDFGAGRGKWTTVSTPELVYDAIRKLVTIPVGTTIEVNVTSVVEWDETIWRNTMAFTGTSGGEFVISFRRDPGGTNDRYRARFLQDGTVELAQIVGGVPTVLATANVPHIIPQGETTMIGINISRACSSDLRIGLRVYDTAVITHVISEPDILPPNAWRLRNLGADPIELDNVIAYNWPPHVDTVEGPGVVADVPVVPVPAPCVLFEATVFGAWTLTPQWHSSTFRSTDGTTSLYFGTGETGYHTWGSAGAMGPGIVLGTATSPSFDASPFPVLEYEVYLEMWVWMDLRNSDVVDILTFEVLDTGVPVYSFIPDAATKSGGLGWQKFRSVNLGPVIGASAAVSVRFTLDTDTAPDPTREGVFIDQVRILIQEV